MFCKEPGPHVPKLLRSCFREPLRRHIAWTGIFWASGALLLLHREQPWPRGVASVVKTPNNGSKIRIGSSNLDQSDGRGPPVRSIKVLAPVSKFRPVVKRFDCAGVEHFNLRFLAGCCLKKLILIKKEWKRLRTIQL